MKILYITVLVTALALAGCRGDQPEKKARQETTGAAKTIVAVGDSLTAGYGLGEEESYPALLEKRLQADGHQYRVINAGATAETSSGTLARIEWILTLQPDIVILETGANDGLRGIDPQLAEKNIREILKILADHDVVVLLAGMRMVRNLGPMYVAEFNAIYPRLAKESGAVFMPFFLEGVAMEASLNQQDGVHPNGAGYKKITDNIYPYVLEVIKRREGRE
ncbi:MAG: arylesterase [Desulforhopalus sp.]|nr:arylesterase [Desulforhopalus sp.]